MRKNNYVYIKSRYDLVKRNAFRGKEIDILYGIMNNRVFVAQGLKIINIGIDLFAEGMDIDLRVASLICNGHYPEVEDAIYEFNVQEGLIERKPLEEVVEETEVTELKEDDEPEEITILLSEYHMLLDIANKFDEYIKDEYYEEEIVDDVVDELEEELEDHEEER